ncbi:MAG: cytochrome c [Acidobacteriota bacterium]|nr:cytochrome c [Acidobacteriota bacterium]
MKFFCLTATTIFVFAISLVTIAHKSMPAAMAAPESPASAAELYNRHCSDCHGKDGRAKGFKAKAKGTRNLTDPQWQERVSDERIFNSINNGKGHMPAFGKKLSEAEIDSLVQYVRGLKK